MGSKTTTLQRTNGHYHIEDGDYDALLPSVTTILGATVAKPGLIAWAAKLGTDKMNTVRQESADFGSTTHTVIQQVVLGTPVDLTKADPILQDLITSLQEWMRLVEFQLIGRPERTVHSKTHGYAGTLDAIAAVYGIPTLIDWKTSNDVYPEMTLQCVAYQRAVLEQGLAQPTLGLIVRLDKKTRRCHPTAVSLGNEAFEAFLHAKALWTWLHADSRPATDMKES